MHPIYNIVNNTMGVMQGSSSHLSSPWSKSGAPNTLPFMAMLDILDFYKLTNDPIYHKLLSLSFPHKIPTDILKFEGKHGEDLGMHITTYNLWCVSNSIVDDSI